MLRFLLPLFFAALGLQGAGIQVLTVDGIINPASEKFISDAVEDANLADRECLIIELDTPGGLMSSMRGIIKSIMASEIPVAVYVSPAGAQAASAGVFITVSAHIAAMAPGTNIGAAHPVNVGGGMFGGGSDSADVMLEKASNDAVAYIQSIADERGRNRDWLKEAVLQSVSITEKEALELNVIDLIAPSMAALIDSLDGRVITVKGREVTLQLSGQEIVREEMNWKYRLLDILSHPNVAYLLMLLGFYGLFFELSNPGTVLPGVLGAFFLILAFYAFQILPVNYAGVALIILGIILFILEVKVTSFGMLTIGGAVAMLLGSFMLFDSADPVLRVSWSIILPSVLFTLLIFGVAVRLVVKAARNRPVTGFEGLLGEEGEANTQINANGGTVFINGELWKAVSDEEISRFSAVIVEDIRHMVLKVRRKGPGPAPVERTDQDIDRR